MSSHVKRTNTKATHQDIITLTWMAAAPSIRSSSIVTWQVTHKVPHLRSQTWYFLVWVITWRDCFPPCCVCLSIRGQGVDGDATQQHRTDHGASVRWHESTSNPLRLRLLRGTDSSHHRPIGTLWAGAVLPLQEVPPPQLTRQDLSYQCVSVTGW